jgi:hypothetical protein
LLDRGYVDFARLYVLAQACAFFVTRAKKNMQFYRQPSPTDRCILPGRGGTMLQQVNQTEARDLEWTCQGVSPMDEPCDSVATGTPASSSRAMKVARDSCLLRLAQ